jgi:endonuclease/exonuclease/phosphatase family metal-dependent hydrolase
MTRTVSLRVATALLSLLSATSAAGAQIRLATWNLEWLVSPGTALALRTRCLRGERRLPCDVVQDAARSAADFHALAREASKLDADVVALQEVEGPDAAARVFPRHRFCFTGRHDLQNVGFAIRAGIPYRCDADETRLSLGDRVRRGAALTLFPGESRELHLLAVHLKSGCSRDSLDSAAGSCALLRRQAPGVASWIEAQAAAGHQFGLLGDFNRDLRAERLSRSGLWEAFAQSASPHAVLADAGGDAPFIPCHSGQPFTRYIDYILLGGALAGRAAPRTFTRHAYRDRDAHQFRLSDHCPLSVDLMLR